MTQLALDLIHALRHSPATQKHFRMNTWVHQRSDCGTMGCIAGTACLMSDLDKEEVFAAASCSDDDYFITNAQRLLGIPFTQTAEDLFIPPHQAQRLLRISRPFQYLPEQAMPPAETVAAMKKFAESFEDQKSAFPSINSYQMFAEITPQRAAFALERLVKDEMPYCNWAEAFEKA